MRTILSSLGLVVMMALACAQPFTYQGLLKQNGTPVNGTYDFEFALFTAATGGTQVGSTLTINDLNVQNGLFTVELDFGSVWDGSPRYLEIRLRPGTSTGGYQQLLPRVKINPTPYAIRANTAGTANPIGAAGGDLGGSYPNPMVVGLQGRSVANTAPSAGQVLKWNGSVWAPASDLTDQLWQVSGADIFYTAGRVGIGTSSPGYRLHVETNIGDTAIYGVHTATSGYTYGVYGESSSPSGRGVVGLATATSGPAWGVYGGSRSTLGYGVYGNATATSGTTYGVVGVSSSTEGVGVFGYATANSGTNYGVYGHTPSPSGRAVFGYASAISGANYGVYGRSDSPSGRGVYGWATATSGTTYGVYGESWSSSGYGVYSSGRFAATGTKSFQIDHPLQPETHFLNHFCTEGPEPYNIYRGTVVLDARGEAWVQLPDYFDRINRDPTYHLTAVGAPMPNLHVAVEIQNNRFKIAGGVPGKKVSWEVKAIRNDRWVQEYGYQTEQEKPKEYQGKYLHPELYGQPKERGISYHPEPERPRELEKPQ